MIRIKARKKVNFNNSGVDKSYYDCSFESTGPAIGFLYHVCLGTFSELDNAVYAGDAVAHGVSYSELGELVKKVNGGTMPRLTVTSGECSIIMTIEKSV